MPTIFSVDSNPSIAANSSKASDRSADAQAGASLTLAEDRNLNYGRGFHSNDARGLTIEVDPPMGVIRRCKASNPWSAPGLRDWCAQRTAGQLAIHLVAVAARGCL